MQEYRTLCFNTPKQALKNQHEIKLYFANTLISSSILQGIDERGNKGFYVKYNLSN